MQDSEEGKAKIQKLEQQLKEQEQSLEDAEYQKYIEDQTQLLDNFLSDLEDWFAERLDNIDDLFAQAIEQTNLNGALIDTTLHEEADAVNYTMTDEFANIWDSYAAEDGIAASSLNILDLTNGTTNDIRLKMDELATEAGLEQFFQGDDLRLLQELTSVQGNTANTYNAIQTANQGLTQIQSNVVEQTNSIGNKIDAATKDIVDAINNISFPSGGGSYFPSGGNDGTTTTTDGTVKKTTPSTSSLNPGNGYGVYNGYGTKIASASTPAQAAAIAKDMQNDAKMNGHNGMPSSVAEKYYKYQVKAYAKGGLIPDEDNPLDIIAQSLGEDHMVAAKEGERILTPEQNEAFEKMVDANFTPLSDKELKKYSLLSGVSSLDLFAEGFKNLSKISIPETNNNMSNIGNTTTTVGDVNISLPNVTNKEEFVSWLKNDGQIERVIQSMTIDRMMGGNSYNKMKY